MIRTSHGEGLTVYRVADDVFGAMYCAEYMTPFGPVCLVRACPISVTAAVLEAAAREWKRWEEMNK